MCLALNATGSVLLHLQWDGRTEQRKLGLSVRTSSPAWSARTSTTFLVSDLDLRGPGVAMAPLTSPSLQGKDVEGGVNRLVVGDSTGICITTVLGQCHLTGLYQQRGTLWEFSSVSSPDAGGLTSPLSAEDGGESAPGQSEESLATLNYNLGWR